MGCQHSDKKILGVSVNCPDCATDKVIQLLKERQITEKQAWQAMFIIAGRYMPKTNSETLA